MWGHALLQKLYIYFPATVPVTQAIARPVPILAVSGEEDVLIVESLKILYSGLRAMRLHLKIR